MDGLYNWGIVTDISYVLCCTGWESCNHLFFECEYTAYVWSRLQDCSLQYRGACEWRTEIEWLSHHLKSKCFANKIKMLAPGAAVYCIWRERNCRIFQGKAVDANILVRQVTKEIRNYVAIWRNVSNTRDNLLLSHSRDFPVCFS